MPAETHTPMMRQYWAIKEHHPDALLFYRMGDFYELFHDDARRASAELNIALTRRGAGLAEDIPMCGVPVHSADNYLLDLIRAGHRVAVCEQIESPEEAKRRGGSKALVRREVVRVVTPGTLTEDTLLDPRRNNFLAAWAEVRGVGAMAWLDLSTGEFRVSSCPRGELNAFASRIAPREMLLPDRDCDDRALLAAVRESGASPTPLGQGSFDSGSAAGRLQGVFGVASLEPFGDFSRTELSVMGAIVDYVELTQRGAAAMIRPPVREMVGEHMQIDTATRRNLELVETLSGTITGSLLDTVDRTVTGAGARLLAARLAAPATALAVIGDRHDAVAWFAEDRARGDAVAKSLTGVPDLERAMARLTLGRGGPRDLGAIRDVLGVAAELAERLGPDADQVPTLVDDARVALSGHGALHDLLARALIDTPPVAVADGDFLAPGYREDLDETRALRDESVSLIGALQEQLRAQTGVVSLRVRHNNVLGYFIEVREKHGHKLRAPIHDGLFIHRQTISSAERFTTTELSGIEGKIASARARAQQIEAEQFGVLRKAVLERTREITTLASALAELDLTVAFARLAAEQEWTRPEIAEDLSLVIEGGRHPVVERALAQAGGTPFVANDCDLSAEDATATPLWILTGPNMAGKSTFLRQVALITILGQSGAFVPARFARVGLVDRLFSRVGAADDLARGRSTFMAEMVETAAILHQATERSLVILDEIGRGTATYDGMAIAWAVIERLRGVNRSRALFATHFHELTELADRMEGIRNASVQVKEWEGDLIFLHEVVPGVADRSYGVQVARLAGLPAAVIRRAAEILACLETDAGDLSDSASVPDALPLFDPREASAAPATAVQPLLRELRAAEPDGMTPLAALELVYRLRTLTDEIKD